MEPHQTPNIQFFIEMNSGKVRDLLETLQPHLYKLNSFEAHDLIKDIISGKVTDITHITQSVNIDAL
jgi:hypothetical protein